MSGFTLQELKRLVEARGWRFRHFTATQREPENGIVIDVARATLRVTSSDDIERCVDDMEAALAELGVDLSERE